MHILTVELTNFRNYRHLSVSLTPGTTILYGANASGKSSFLEALTMLATTRSPRASAEREVIHWDAPMDLGTSWSWAGHCACPFLRPGLRFMAWPSVNSNPYC